MIISNNELDLLKMAMEAEITATQDMYDDNRDASLRAQLVQEKNLYQLLLDEDEKRHLPGGNRYVSLDPDTQIYYLDVIDNYRSYLNGDMHSKTPLSIGEISKYMDECYMLGNIEGRLVQGTITADDVETIEGWQDMITGVPGKRVIKVTIYGHLDETDMGDIMETLSHDFYTMGFESEIKEVTK